MRMLVLGTAMALISMMPAARASADIVLTGSGGSYTLDSADAGIVVSFLSFTEYYQNGANGDNWFVGSNANAWSVGDRYRFYGHATNGVDSEFALELIVRLTNEEAVEQTASMTLDAGFAFEVDLSDGSRELTADNSFFSLRRK